MQAKWYIRSVYTSIVGEQWDNQEVFARICAHLPSHENWPEAEIGHLLSLIRVFLIGSRSRYVQCPYFLDLRSFKDHAAAFTAAVAESIGSLSKEVRVAGSEAFDAVIGVSSVGQLWPGIADRLATGLQTQVKSDALLLDLSNGGCTASSRALQLASTLDSRHRNGLIAVGEPTSTLADPFSLDRPHWQGICTFGDGAAGIWLSTDPAGALAELGSINSSHRIDADLIHWDYSRLGER